MKKSVFVMFIFLIVITFIVFYSYDLEYCNDGTPNNKCSNLISFYCENGNLVKNTQKCGCLNNNCYEDFKNNPENYTFDYYLKGDKENINITLYKGVDDYLFNLSDSFNLKDEKNLSRQYLKSKRINNEVQDFFINSLVAEIINNGKSKKEQLRIASSLVQNIYYNLSKKDIYFSGLEINSPDYPYEVLYNEQGVCQGKSDLLALLLKKIGYETVILHFEEENHDVVGVKCPIQYSFQNTGYCIIETTKPSILFDSEIIYENGLRLRSTPKIIFISQGDSVDYRMYEYKDAKKLNKINNKILNNKYLNPIDRVYLERLKEKYNIYYMYR